MARGTRKFLSNQSLIAVEDISISSAPASDPNATTAEAMVVYVAGSGSGGATALKQDEQTDLLETIATAAQDNTTPSPVTISQTTPGTTNGVVVNSSALPTGAATAALQGALTETAPATDTASSGLNGRLQRIAQRLTSLIALLPASLGAKAASASLSVVQAGLEYETVAASQTAQALGATGATGDFLSHVIIQPTTTAAGTVTILDNATVIFTFTTGTLGDLRPLVIPISAFSVSGAWKITTGANVTATGFGDFT